MEAMCALDEEDGTINTRLAMGAINSMFCSPTPASKYGSSSSAGGAGRSGSNTRNRQTVPAFAVSSDLSAIQDGSGDASVFALNTPTMTATHNHTKMNMGTGGANMGFSIFED